MVEITNWNQTCSSVSWLPQSSVLPNLSLMDISIWGTQGQTAELIFSETSLLHILLAFQKANHDFKQYFRSSYVNQSWTTMPHIHTIKKKINQNLVALSASNGTRNLPWSCRINWWFCYTLALSTFTMWGQLMALISRELFSEGKQFSAGV